LRPLNTVASQLSALALEVDGPALDGSERARACNADLDRPCSDSELLHYLLQSESSRQELERHTNDLKNRLHELATAIRETEQATQSKSDFLATMSHEIRTPLNGIIGMTSVLLAKNLGSTERDCVETIRSSGEALLAVIDGILDFSKIEAGRLELDCVEFSPAFVLQDAIHIVSPAAARKSLELAIVTDPNLPSSVRGDMIRLRQVLLNLLSNAVKFTDSGTIELKAELLSRAPATYKLRFSVADRGIGITEEEQARLFQPFTQANASTARSHGGTGLGLAICKQLVELMGGRIGVESRSGEGSTFWFTMDVLAPESSPALAEAPAPEPSANGAAPKNFRILLVEDNAVNQKVALLMLKKLGHSADVAQNGVEAIAALAAKEYDLVLMDCLMPEMDGFEATRRIRTSARNAKLPIVAMTANAFTEDREACLEAGMSDYLSKPVRDSELRQKLDRWLPNRSA